MSTCTTVDACTKSGFGNVEGVCNFNVVGRAGKGEYFIGVAGRFHCCCCFRLLLSFLGVSSPWPLTFFASSFRPAVSLGVACVFTVLACHARCGFLFAPVAAMLPSPLFLTKSCECGLRVFGALVIDYMMLCFLRDEVMRSSGFIALDGDVPSKVLARSAAVIVWRVGWYDSRSEDMMIVL